MDVAAIIIMIVVLIILSGVTVFLIKDYLSYKDATNNALDDASSRIKQEGDTRLSNLKYIVDKVNVVNTDIYNTYTASNADINNRITATSNISTRTLNGLNHFFQFSSNVSVGSANVSLLDLPGFVAPDVRLIKHVTMVSGLTVRDIDTTSNVEFCSREDPNRCIKFADASGNTLLTSMRNGARVVLDTDTNVNGNLTFNNTNKLPYGTISPSGATNTNMRIAASNIFLETQDGKVGISTSAFTPGALLHIRSTSTNEDIFRATTDTGEVTIDKDGILNVPRLNVTRLMIGNNTIEEDTSTNGIRITVPNGGIKVTTTNSETRFGQPVTISDRIVLTQTS